MAEGNPEKPKSPNKQLSNSDTLDEEPINPILKTSVEERYYGMILGSALATQDTQATLATPGPKQSHNGKRTQL